MRIIAGYLGGRNIVSNSNKTHPMSEKIRGAIFNALGDITDLSVLDAFSGSGAVAIEAVSRGASSVIALENDKKAQVDIVTNLKNLGIETKVKLIKTSIFSWSALNPGFLFDLVICDPPYNNLYVPQIPMLEDHLNFGGTLVLSWPPKIELPLFIKLKIASQKSYNDANLVFYKKTK